MIHRFFLGIFVGFFLLTSQVPSYAQNPLSSMYQGQTLFNLLQTDNSYLKYYVMGYVTGLAFMYDDLGSICIDKEIIDQGVLCNHVVEYLQNNPEKKEELSSTIVKKALQGVYPCNH